MYSILCCVGQGRTEACKVLIAKGNDVNAMANSGGTSLMFASGAGHTEAAKVLLDAGADVNAKLQATPEYLEQVRVFCFISRNFIAFGFFFFHELDASAAS